MNKACLAGVALTLAAGAASAGLYEWNWSAGDSASNNGGGNLESVHTTFNTFSEVLTFSVTFGDQRAEGFTLAMSDGPNPKGDSGELALLYFDANNMAAPIMSAYGYNGENTQTSYYDGTKGGGTGTPDRIATSLDAGDAAMFQSLSATDHGGKRTFSFTLDASAINAHSPLHGTTGTDWAGIGFDDQMGIWLHPVRNLNTAYNAEGYLTDWSGGNGWLDGANFQTTLVPAPGTAALIALGGLVSARRRRV